MAARTIFFRPPRHKGVHGFVSPLGKGTGQGYIPGPQIPVSRYGDKGVWTGRLRVQLIFDKDLTRQMHHRHQLVELQTSDGNGPLAAAQIRQHEGGFAVYFGPGGRRGDLRQQAFLGHILPRRQPHRLDRPAHALQRLPRTPLLRLQHGPVDALR